ncbi:hypothetical protein I0Q12_04920 [Rhodococcus sp. CX]|uniref:hypothetical protein n=1 Tax=Rhodococcus sp. CX TaxID=2789880 RepID=UPI0018CECC54|nr:hypothetical protein [Rhodococcus sp. CX]MBH0118904.1 hypothetical protein [Rhodococcus sp. CX]
MKLDIEKLAEVAPNLLVGTYLPLEESDEETYPPSPPPSATYAIRRRSRLLRRPTAADALFTTLDIHDARHRENDHTVYMGEFRTNAPAAFDFAGPLSLPHLLDVPRPETGRRDRPVFRHGGSGDRLMHLPAGKTAQISESTPFDACSGTTTSLTLPTAT